MNSNHSPLLACRRWNGFLSVAVLWTFVVFTVTGAVAQQSLGGLSMERPTTETGIRLGKARMHGALAVQNSYDSNALYSDTSPEADYVLEIIPGADVTFESTRFAFDTGYRFTLRRQLENSVQNDNQQTARLNLSYRLARRISLKAGDRYEDSSEPADIEIPERVGRRTNEAHGEISYETPGQDFGMSLKYLHTYNSYDAALAALSFYQQKVTVTSRVNASSYFRFLPKSIASMSMDLAQTNFQDDPAGGTSNSDSKGFQVSAGLSSQFTRKLSASAQVGGTFLYFDTGPDTQAITWTFSSTFQPNPKFNMTASFNQSVQTSTFTNYYTDQRYSLEARWKFARRFDATFNSAVDFLDYSGPNTNADGSERSDSVIQLGEAVSYQFIQWGRLSLAHRMAYRDSNTKDPVFGTSSANFSKHTVTLGVDLYY